MYASASRPRSRPRIEKRDVCIGEVRKTEHTAQFRAARMGGAVVRAARSVGRRGSIKQAPEAEIPPLPSFARVISAPRKGPASPFDSLLLDTGDVVYVHKAVRFGSLCLLEVHNGYGRGMVEQSSLQLLPLTDPTLPRALASRIAHDRFAVAATFAAAVEHYHRDELMSLVLPLLLSRGEALPFVGALLEHEAKLSPALAFRRSTTFSKAVQAYFRSLGQPFLALSVKPLLIRVCAGDLATMPFEMDTNRAIEGADLAANHRNLEFILDLFWESLCRYAAHLPSPIRLVCRNIAGALDLASRKEEAHAPPPSVSAVGHALIVWFVCPAIVCPEKFIPSLKTLSIDRRRRLLVVVAKVLMVLGQGRQFSHMEPWTLPLNNWLRRHEVPYLQLCHAVCANSPDTLTAICVRHLHASLGVYRPLLHTLPQELSSLVVDPTIGISCMTRQVSGIPELVEELR